MSKIYYPELNAFLKKAIEDKNYTITFNEDWIYNDVNIIFPKAYKRRKISFSRKVYLSDIKNQYVMFNEKDNFREMNFLFNCSSWWSTEFIKYNLIVDDDLHDSIVRLFKEKLSNETRKLREEQAQHDIIVTNSLK